MSKFKLLEREVFSEVVENTYSIQYNGDKIIYKEFVSYGEVIDFALTDKDGKDIGNEELMMQVMEFIDNLQ